MNGRPADIYSLGKICSPGKNTQREAFLFWDSDLPANTEVLQMRVWQAEQRTEKKNNPITFGFQSGLALYLSLLLWIRK